MKKKPKVKTTWLDFCPTKKKMGAVYFQWSFSSILACFTVRDRGNQIGRYINLVDKKTNLKTTWLSFLSTLEEKKQIIFTGDEYKRNGY